jgi:hypothetical protein
VIDSMARGGVGRVRFWPWPRFTALVMVDLDARMSVSYVMNQMLDQGLGDYRGLGVVMAADEGVP